MCCVWIRCDLGTSWKTAYGVIRDITCTGTFTAEQHQRGVSPIRVLPSMELSQIVLCFTSDRLSSLTSSQAPVSSCYSIMEVYYPRASPIHTDVIWKVEWRSAWPSGYQCNRPVLASNGQPLKYALSSCIDWYEGYKQVPLELSDGCSVPRTSYCMGHCMNSGEKSQKYTWRT